MSVALGTVFILNSIALFIFPMIGHRLGMTQPQFGVWAAIAIHDTSSVVGAAAKYGAEALQIATTVKLTRALWIVPAHARHRILLQAQVGASSTIPWFILCFVIASVLRTYIAAPAEVWSTLTMLARIGLTITLFLIGAGLSRKSIAAVGARPLILGVILWIAISCVSLCVRCVRGRGFRGSPCSATLSTLPTPSHQQIPRMERASVILAAEEEDDRQR